MVAETSSSSARPAENNSRILPNAGVEIEKLPDYWSDAIKARTCAASRPQASNSSRSKFDDT